MVKASSQRIPINVIHNPDFVKSHYSSLNQSRFVHLIPEEPGQRILEDPPGLAPDGLAAPS